MILIFQELLVQDTIMVGDLNQTTSTLPTRTLVEVVEQSSIDMKQ